MIYIVDTIIAKHLIPLFFRRIPMCNGSFLIFYIRGGILWQDFTVEVDQAARMEVQALAILVAHLLVVF